ncbi:hypothetical protein CL6EHI_035110 [Entamoeba histolytica]|uniref:Serine aminopeptidase S33 domain-containing protein n=4 Tax=Entamoeba histolytica TaxID=5759 RepID=C4M501_ENTH1|nr:hypothetical protein EHI_035110 [Entamoeba histolytica HM-1:IMSS]EAL43740.1 hypothetical protein EHI_035110 [Entamoeba histolytica HM-1:IMSS]ENY59820.1 hypothetical protein EHI7A_204810 [Entamoeba histolytica HM-1:IMSS-A]GAT96459.1 hypothetical protein CL6EHI_035110 [Entamoeba histolytica]|eukprot:XP_649128.1 hypothetical protein EHI_035110 [Entamoeba histolytica HM-1:IMSS]
MEQQTQVSLKKGAKHWKKRKSSHCESFPHYLEINGSIPSVIISPSDQQPKCTILYSHHSTERLETIYEWLRKMSLLLHSVVVGYEYPGYMNGTTEFSEDSLAKVIVQVFDYVVNTMNVDSSKIILFGKGAGAASTLFQAYKCRKEHMVGGVILVNPLVNMSLVTLSKFQKVSHIKAVTAPVAVIFGQLISEKKYIRKLYSLLQNKKGIAMVDNGSYDLETHFCDELTDEIIKFLVGFIPDLAGYFNGDEIEKERPKEYQFNSFDEISAFLSQRNLQHLTDLLISFGYCTVDNFMTMFPDEYDFLGLEPNDLVAFKQLVEDAKKDPSLLHPKTKRKSYSVMIPNAKEMFSDEALKDLNVFEKRGSVKDILFQRKVKRTSVPYLLTTSTKTNQDESHEPTHEQVINVTNHKKSHSKGDAICYKKHTNEKETKAVAESDEKTNE